MSAESEKLLRESTIKELAKSDQEIEKIYQELSKIHLSVKQRITRIKNCTEYVKKRQEYDKLIEDGGVFDKVRKDEMRNYVSQKFKDQQKELLNNFKAGYQLVESIREIIVGEPINYAIAQDNGDELIVYNLNTMHSRCGSQVPFSSVNVALFPELEGQEKKDAAMICRLFLEEYKKGLGKGEQPIFPSILFRVKNGFNANPEDEFYDLRLLAESVTSRRMNPTFMFVDSPANEQVLKDGCKPTTMG